MVYKVLYKKSLEDLLYKFDILMYALKWKWEEPCVYFSGLKPQSYYLVMQIIT